MSILSLTLVAYVGPGAGLGALGALFAVVAAVFLGLAGLIVYPIQLLRKRWAKRTSDAAPAAPSDGAPAS